MVIFLLLIMLVAFLGFGIYLNNLFGFKGLINSTLNTSKTPSFARMSTSGRAIKVGNNWYPLSSYKALKRAEWKAYNSAKLLNPNLTLKDFSLGQTNNINTTLPTVDLSGSDIETTVSS